MSIQSQAIIWTNFDPLSIESLWSDFNESWIKIRKWPWTQKIHLKMLTAGWWSFSSGLNILIIIVVGGIWYERLEIFNLQMQERIYKGSRLCHLCIYTLRWRHNGRDSVSNHQPHHCLLSRLFRRRSKKTSKLRVTGLCVGNSPGTGEFSAQMASNAKNASIWWRHHVMP